MKKQNIIYTVIAVIAVGIAIYFAVKPANSIAEKEAEPAAEKPHEETAVKEVALNEAQYNAAGVALGTFSMKNLSDVVNANGYTKLPPQNQADISVHLGGVVQTIKVIEGEFVKKGEVLATIESPEFAKLQEAYLTSKSNLEFLSLEYDR